ncbi:MAG: hypothetical protein K2P37_00110 [Oscillospiraceae bacterium]|nr:hypothetical protein [Oscillospiraceae bacterium]
MKKILSLCAALALAASLGGPAVAAEGPAEAAEDTSVTETVPEVPDELPGERPEEAPGEVPADDGEAPGLPWEDIPAVAEEPPVINVLLPGGGRVVANPYGLAVPTEYGVSREPVVHTPQALTNLNDFPVTVNAAVAGTIAPGSEAVFVSAPPAPDAPGKDVFLYVEFSSQYDWWAGSYRGLPNQLPVSEWETAGENVLTLDAGGVGYFRLFGEVSEAPDTPWSDTDTFDAVLTFTFAPLYPDPEPVEEPEAPEEEIPEEALPPDAPEEDPPEEITPPDITEEDPAPPEEEPETPDTPEPDTPEEPGPETPDEEEPPEGPEAPADPSEPPISPDEESVDGTDEKTEDL